MGFVYFIAYTDAVRHLKKTYPDYKFEVKMPREDLFGFPLGGFYEVPSILNLNDKKISFRVFVDKRNQTSVSDDLNFWLIRNDAREVINSLINKVRMDADVVATRLRSHESGYRGETNINKVKFDKNVDWLLSISIKWNENDEVSNDDIAKQALSFVEILNIHEILPGSYHFYGNLGDSTSFDLELRRQESDELDVHEIASKVVRSNKTKSLIQQHSRSSLTSYLKKAMKPTPSG